MNKILVLQGCPASGKSTFARQFVSGKNNWVIVNRDSIRDARGDYWIPSQENYISDIEEFQIKAALKRNLNVIIDATNLNPKTIANWENIAKEYNVEIEYKLFKVSYEDAIKRDSNRERSVGEKVIKTFFSKYFPDELPKNKYSDDRVIKPLNNILPKAIIVDLDGTVSLRKNRSPYDYSKVHLDNCDERLQEVIKSICSNDVTLIFLTGREGTDECRKNTVAWINKHFGSNYILYMRNENDKRKDNIIKMEIYNDEIEPNYSVISVFEDRDRNVKMFRDLGLLCCQVYYGEF